MSAKLQTVHVRVNDAATGLPTPVRVRFTDADGTYHAPLGRLTDFATGRNQDVGGNVRLGMKPWAYVDGSFEINLPSGTIQVEIHKGPEYRPLAQTVQLTSGKLALRFAIERWLDLPARGWYSGDGRAHCLSPHAALLEAQAEDLHVINLLAASTEIADQGDRKNALTNILAFSGQNPAVQTPGYVVVVNTHNRHPALGSLGLLNCHRVVHPLIFGGPLGHDDWTLADWCDQCHRKSGLVVWTRPGQGNADFFLGEPLLDLLLGKIDAIEIDQDSPPGVLPLWYDVLDAGIQVPLIGSSGKESNALALGAMRTYGHLGPGEAFAYQAWIEAVRAGRTFVTNGPALLLTVNDRDPGAVIDLESAGDIVYVRALVQSQAPLQNLEILVNGRVAFATEHATLEVDLPIHAGGWLAARCRGQVVDHPATQSLFAHTSPIYVRIREGPGQVNRAAIGRLRVHIDRMEMWVRQKANCRGDHDRARFSALVAAARAVLANKP